MEWLKLSQSRFGFSADRDQFSLEIITVIGRLVLLQDIPPSRPRTLQVLLVPPQYSVALVTLMLRRPSVMLSEP